MYCGQLSKMISASGICLGLAVLLVVNLSASNAGRIPRSPQFSRAQASAQAGGRFSRPNFGPPGPGFGGPGFNRPGFGGRPGQGGGSISISKSISISRGGVASSNAGSSAAGK